MDYDRRCAKIPRVYNRNTYLREHVERGFEVEKLYRHLSVATRTGDPSVKETRQTCLKSSSGTFLDPRKEDSPGTTRFGLIWIWRRSKTGQWGVWRPCAQ